MAEECLDCQETPEQTKARLLRALNQCLKVVGQIVTYLTRHSKRGIEVTFLTHVWRMINIYIEYATYDKPEAYLISMFERERRDFYSTRAQTDRKIDRYEVYNDEQKTVQARVKEAFGVAATVEYIDRLLGLAGSLDRAMEFLDWLASGPTPKLTGIKIHSMKFIIGCFAQFEESEPDDDELRRLERRAARAEQVRQSVK